MKFAPKKTIQSHYLYLLMTGLALTVICAWCSTGITHPDEYFQIFEFCNYKMGKSSSADLPWEFSQQVRSSILPGIAYLFGEWMIWMGLYNPFTLVFILRLLTGITSWFIISSCCLLSLSRFKTDKGRLSLILLSMLLWYMPFLSVRFTPENIAGLIFLSGVFITLYARQHWIKYFIFGLLFGLSFDLRIQITPALAGFIFWLVFIKKTTWNNLAILFISMLIATSIGVLIDHWFYGEWTFTPFNYFYANIIQHKAESFGVTPWWFYICYFFVPVIYPMGFLLFPLHLTLLILFITGVIKNLKDPLVWSIIPFLLAHSLIGHKELRFLFPMTFVFIYLVSKGLDHWFNTLDHPKVRSVNNCPITQSQPTLSGLYAESKPRSVGSKLNCQQTLLEKILIFIFLLNLGVLMSRTVTPSAFFTENFYHMIYNMYESNKTITIYSSSADKDPFLFAGLPINFFKPKHFHLTVMDDNIKLQHELKSHESTSQYFIGVLPDSFNSKTMGYKGKLIYTPKNQFNVAHFFINSWENEYLKTKKIWYLEKTV